MQRQLRHPVVMDVVDWWQKETAFLDGRSCDGATENASWRARVRGRRDQVRRDEEVRSFRTWEREGRVEHLGGPSGLCLAAGRNGKADPRGCIVCGTVTLCESVSSSRRLYHVVWT